MGATSKLVVNEEKKFRGPLKKRPIDNFLNDSQQLQRVDKTNFSFNMRSNQKVKVVQTIKKEMSSDREEESPPPTIAAGRSRRAIKPNPKYTSEDMLTPKIVRNVGFGAKSVTNTNQNRQRNISSSSDDFFNNDSSDNMNTIHHNDDADDGTDDIVYRNDDKDAVDSDFSERAIEKPLPRPSRGRGRPRKAVLPETLVHTKTKSGNLNTGTSARVIQVASTTIRAQSTQFQQMQRSIGTGTSQRNLNSIGGEKRKLDNDGEMNMSMKRRQVIRTSNDQRMCTPVRGSKENSNVSNTPSNDTKVVRKIIPASLQTLNDNKIVKTHTLTNVPNMFGEKKLDQKFELKNIAQKQQKILVSSLTGDKPSVSTTPTSFSSTQAKILAARATAAASRLKVDTPRQQLKDNMQNSSKTTSNSMIRGSQIKKLNSSSGTKIQNAKNSFISAQRSASIEKTTSPLNSTANTSEEKLSSRSNDFETMPTFTIVNVNDIINKKGDVLITKSKSINNNKVQCKSNMTVPVEEVNQKRERNVNRPRLDVKRKSEAVQHQILNHKIALRNAQTATNVRPIITTPIDKPAPRILNPVVAKKTRPVKPLIANMTDSADEGFALSMDEESEDEHDMKSQFMEENVITTMKDESMTKGAKIESKIYNQRQKQTKHTYAVGNQKKKISLAPSLSTKENSLSNINQASSHVARKATPEKVVISRQGDKIIKKITCFETWYVINVKNERPHLERSQFEMPLIKLANVCKTIPLPSMQWSCKVTLYELSAATLAKSTFITYTGNLEDHNIAEEDRSKYQPSCVIFRRSIIDGQKSRMPYDRAVIFKNKTFYTNIEGKNVKLIAAPSIINNVNDVEILLQIVDSLSLQSDFVEQATTMQ